MNAFIPPLKNISVILRIILQCGCGNYKQNAAGLTSVTMTRPEDAIGFRSVVLVSSW